MKKILSALFVIVVLAMPTTSWTYSLRQFTSESKWDTKQVLGKDFTISLRFNTLDRKQNFAASSNMLAWKPIAAGVAILSPSSLDQQAEVAVDFALRLERIPLNLRNGEEVGDYFKRKRMYGWWDHVTISFHLVQNLSTGMFQFPLVVAWNF